MYGSYRPMGLRALCVDVFSRLEAASSGLTLCSALLLACTPVTFVEVGVLRPVFTPLGASSNDGVSLTGEIRDSLVVMLLSTQIDKAFPYCLSLR